MAKRICARTLFLGFDAVAARAFLDRMHLPLNKASQDQIVTTHEYSNDLNYYHNADSGIWVDVRGNVVPVSEIPYAPSASTYDYRLVPGNFCNHYGFQDWLDMRGYVAGYHQSSDLPDDKVGYYTLSGGQVVGVVQYSMIQSSHLLRQYQQLTVTVAESTPLYGFDGNTLATGKLSDICLDVSITKSNPALLAWALKDRELPLPTDSSKDDTPDHRSYRQQIWTPDNDTEYLTWLKSQSPEQLAVDVLASMLKDVNVVLPSGQVVDVDNWGFRGSEATKIDSSRLRHGNYILELLRTLPGDTVWTLLDAVETE